MLELEFAEGRRWFELSTTRKPGGGEMARFMVLARNIGDLCFDDLDAPVARVTLPDMAIPYSEPLEMSVLPNAEKIRDAVLKTVA